jgi:TRAP-type C4-dicarboxylate transport system permease large subunit
MLGEMTKAYNAFILLAVPFFLLAANIMNAAGITERLVDLTRCMVGQFRGGLAYVNIVVSMIFAIASRRCGEGPSSSGDEEAGHAKLRRGDHGLLLGHGGPSPPDSQVVWGGVMSVSVGALFLAGFIPGIMVGLSQMGTTFVYARLRNYPVYARATLREFFTAFGRASFAMMTRTLSRRGGRVLHLPRPQSLQFSAFSSGSLSTGP